MNNSIPPPMVAVFYFPEHDSFQQLPCLFWSSIAGYKVLKDAFKAAILLDGDLVFASDAPYFVGYEFAGQFDREKWELIIVKKKIKSEISRQPQAVVRQFPKLVERT